jgi:hypothetical protein
VHRSLALVAASAPAEVLVTFTAMPIASDPVPSDRSDVVRLKIAAVRGAVDVRHGGLDMTHVQRLTGVIDDLPPVLVHSSTMRLLDGAHRIAAAQAAGRDEVPAILFTGDAAEAFEVAISSNARHGLPMTARERTDAAERLLLLVDLDWSDRRVARCCGLSPTTVGRVRAHLVAAGVHSGQGHGTRTGRDGKRYPATNKRPSGTETEASPPERPRRRGIGRLLTRVLEALIRLVRSDRQHFRRGRLPVLPRSPEGDS